MDETFKLAQTEHDRVYREIERDMLSHVRSEGSPHGIITGGQPGSGKSKLLESSKKSFPEGNVAVINGDDLRNYHPARRHIFKLDDKRFAERTDPDSRVWTKRLFDTAIDTKRNIIFESTMREAGPLSETFRRLRDRGYQITAKVVAAHERMSITGVFRRYEEQKAEKGFGRWSPLSSHDAGYLGMPKTVEHIEKNMLVDQLEVYNRNGKLLFENQLCGTSWQVPDRAIDVIEAERRRMPTGNEIDQFHADWQRILELMTLRNAPELELAQARSTFSKLEKTISKPS